MDRAIGGGRRAKRSRQRRRWLVGTSLREFRFRFQSSEARTEYTAIDCFNQFTLGIGFIGSPGMSSKPP